MRPAVRCDGRVKRGGVKSARAGDEVRVITSGGVKSRRRRGERLEVARASRDVTRRVQRRGGGVRSGGVRAEVLQEFVGRREVFAAVLRVLYPVADEGVRLVGLRSQHEPVRVEVRHGRSDGGERAGQHARRAVVVVMEAVWSASRSRATPGGPGGQNLRLAVRTVRVVAVRRRLEVIAMVLRQAGVLDPFQVPLVARSNLVAIAAVTSRVERARPWRARARETVRLDRRGRRNGRRGKDRTNGRRRRRRLWQRGRHRQERRATVARAVGLETRMVGARLMADVEVHAAHAVRRRIEAMSVRGVGQVRVLKRREAPHVSGLRGAKLRAFAAGVVRMAEGIDDGVLARSSKAGLLGAAGGVAMVELLRFVVLVRLERRLRLVRAYLVRGTSVAIGGAHRVRDRRGLRRLSGCHGLACLLFRLRLADAATRRCEEGQRRLFLFATFLFEGRKHG